MTRTYRPWTYPEERRLRQLADLGLSDAEIAALLGRPRASVERKRWRIGAAKYRPHRRHDAAVRRMARQGWWDREIAEVLGLTRAGVELIRRRLGVAAGRFASDRSWEEVTYGEGARLARAGERPGVASAGGMTTSPPARPRG